MVSNTTDVKLNRYKTGRINVIITISELMVKRITVVLAVLTFQLTLTAQQHNHFQCGTSGELALGMIKYLKANKAAIKAGFVQLRNDIVYVPVKFHIVTKDDGTRGVSEENILDMVCATNEDFLDQNIQFYIKDEFNYINSDAVFDDHQQTQRGIMSFSKDNQAINVFMLENVSQNPAVGGYYTSSFDWIVVRNSDVNSSYVLTHEIGHFFTLPHPFQGWDATGGFSPSAEGQRVPVNSPRGIPSERVDGSNCEDAGDFICDTPADYNAFNSLCSTDFPILDPDSVEISPDQRLFMSYFQCEARSAYYFTDMQKEIIAADLASGRRRVLVNANPTTTAQVSGSPTNQFPANTEIINISDPVTFRWTAVENANRYLVQIDRLPNFNSPSLITLVANDNEVVVDNLETDANYFWRVLPYNEYWTCEGFGSRTVFRTTLDIAVSSNDLQSVDSWSIFPNPVQNKVVNLYINANANTIGHVAIFDASGKKVISLLNQTISAGENNISIDVSNLSAGVFSLSFVSNEGYLSDKLIILN